MKKIIFKNNDDSVGIITPFVDDIDEIAKKDTPAGLPYWIVDESVLPADRTMRDAWEIDDMVVNEPDGYGI